MVMSGDVCDVVPKAVSVCVGMCRLRMSRYVKII